MAWILETRVDEEEELIISQVGLFMDEYHDTAECLPFPP